MRGPNGQPPVQTGYADVHNARLYYEVAGEGEPLVLVHHGLFDRRMWDDQFAEFAQSYRVIRYDLRGCGQSALTLDDYSHVADLFGLLDFLRLDRVNLVGHALGGALCVDAALASPKRVSALVLASPILSGYTEMTPAVAEYQRVLSAALAQKNVAGAVDASLAMWVVGPRRRPEVVERRLRERARLLLTESFRLPRPIDGPQPSGAPAIDRLSEIDTPTLVLVGKLDVSDTYRVADLLISEIDDAGLVEMSGAGHLLNMEQPERFNQLVLDFLGG